MKAVRFLFCLSIFFFGCQQATVTSESHKAKKGTSSQQKTLNLYGSADRDWVAAVAKKYEKETGVKVNWVRGSGNEMYARISAEKNNPQGDVWFGGTGDPHFDAARKGMTTPYCTKLREQLRDEAKDPLGSCKVTGLYSGPLGFAVNKTLLEKQGKAIPTSWADLVKPEYKKLVAMANPNTSGTAYTSMATVLQVFGKEKGWDYLKSLHKNIAQYTKSGSAPGQLAGRGEVAVAIMFLHDVVTYAEEGYPVIPISPSEGTGYEIGGLSLIKGGPNPEVAKEFMDWALKPEVQRIARDHRSFQLQSNKNVDLPAQVTKYGVSFEDIKTIDYDFEWAAANRQELIERWSKEVFSLPRG